MTAPQETLSATPRLLDDTRNLMQQAMDDTEQLQKAVAGGRPWVGLGRVRGACGSSAAHRPAGRMPYYSGLQRDVPLDSRTWCGLCRSAAPHTFACGGCSIGACVPTGIDRSLWTLKLWKSPFAFLRCPMGVERSFLIVLHWLCSLRRDSTPGLNTAMSSTSSALELQSHKVGQLAHKLGQVQQDVTALKDTLYGNAVASAAAASAAVEGRPSEGGGGAGAAAVGGNSVRR